VGERPEYGFTANQAGTGAEGKTAALVYFPEERKYEFKVMDHSAFVGHVLECYVHKMVSKAGTAAIHRCAAKVRFDS
jgi:hypothetical protein